MLYFERKCDWELKIDALLKEIDDKFQLFSPEDPRLIEMAVIQKTGFTNPSKQIESCEQLLDYSLNKEKAKKIAFETPGKRIKIVQMSEKLEIPHLPSQATRADRKDIPFPCYTLRKKATYIVVEKWEDVYSVRDAAKKIKGKVKIVTKKR